jgi:hypothetical protein
LTKQKPPFWWRKKVSTELLPALPGRRSGWVHLPEKGGRRKFIIRSGRCQRRIRDSVRFMPHQKLRSSNPASANRNPIRQQTLSYRTAAAGYLIGRLTDVGTLMRLSYPVTQFIACRARDAQIRQRRKRGCYRSRATCHPASQASRSRIAAQVRSPARLDPKASADWGLPGHVGWNDACCANSGPR